MVLLDVLGFNGVSAKRDYPLEYVAFTQLFTKMIACLEPAALNTVRLNAEDYRFFPQCLLEQCITRAYYGLMRALFLRIDDLDWRSAAPAALQSWCMYPYARLFMSGLAHL
jgi:hypothetical protein